MRVRNIVVLLVVLAVLGGVYFAVSRPEPTPPAQPIRHIWSIADRDIEHIKISLPREGKSQAFLKISEGDKFPWFFDDPPRSPVDIDRWGGGITLLLSGPGADRIITEQATEEKLIEYGLSQPSMTIMLTMANQATLKIDAGDRTPNGNNYYVRVQDSSTVATVDYTWYEVIARLVTDPPYAAADQT